VVGLVPTRRIGHQLDQRTPGRHADEHVIERQKRHEGQEMGPASPPQARDGGQHHGAEAGDEQGQPDGGLAELERLDQKSVV